MDNVTVINAAQQKVEAICFINIFISVIINEVEKFFKLLNKCLGTSN